MKSKRVLAAREEARRQAYATKRPIFSGRLPGWVALKAGKLVAIPERAKVVREVYAMALRGVGGESIARTLNKRGVETWGYGKAKASMWSHAYVRKILANEAVIGTYCPHLSEGKKRQPLAPIENYYPRIIDGKIWNAAQRLRESHHQGRTVGTPAVQNVLGGLATCARCGSSMVQVYKGSVRKLVCRAARLGKGCVYASIDLPLIEAALCRNPDTFTWVVLRKDVVAAARTLARTDAELESVEAEIERLTDAIAEKASSALKRSLAGKEAEAERLRDEKRGQTFLHDDLAKGLLARRVVALQEALKAVPLDKRAVNVLLRQVLARVEIEHHAGTEEMHPWCWLKLLWHNGHEVAISVDLPPARSGRKPFRAAP